KGRGVYETPGGAILHFAHRQMETLTMDREVMQLRDSLIPKYSSLVYNGFWFSPEREALQALVTESQRNVTGGVKLKLYKCDIIGYSKLLITEQSELLRRLTNVVRETEQFRFAEAEGKLVRLPTGDGMALVFRNSPEAPVQCSLELSKRLKAHPELSVRMGIH